MRCCLRFTITACRAGRLCCLPRAAGWQLCTGGSFGACGAAVMPICSTDAAITGGKCLDCRCISVICLAILKTEYDDEPLSAAQRFFFFSDSIQKVIKSGYLNLFLPVLSLRNEPTRISCELPHSPAHRFCIFHRSSPSPSTLKPPNTTGKPTRCPTSSAVQRGPT